MKIQIYFVPKDENSKELNIHNAGERIPGTTKVEGSSSKLVLTITDINKAKIPQLVLDHARIEKVELRAEESVPTFKDKYWRSPYSLDGHFCTFEASRKNPESDRVTISITQSSTLEVVRSCYREFMAGKFRKQPVAT